MTDVQKVPLSDPDARPSILLVDDDQVFVERLARALRARGYDVRVAGDHDSALALARAESPEHAVVDLRMPGPSGLEVVRDMKSIDPSTNILVLTGYGSIATAVEAIRLGAKDYLPKPADVDDILPALNRSPDDKQVVPSDFQAPSLARRVGAHPPRAHRLRGERIRGRAPARNPPPIAPAQAPAVPASGVTGPLRATTCRRACPCCARGGHLETPWTCASIRNTWLWRPSPSGAARRRRRRPAAPFRCLNAGR
jgi:two-component system response regulator RegA